MRSFFVPAQLLCGLVLLSFVVGCGTQTYEERLALTKEYYAYVDKLSANLAPQYNNYGLTMRVPQQFSELPGPVRKPRRPPAEGENAEASAAEEEEVVDPRQPEFFEAPLPGLAAAWKANLNTVTADGSTEQKDGYLYLLSNYDLWRTYKTKNAAGDPVKFHEEVMDMLVNELQIPIDDRQRGTATDHVNKWYQHQVPKAEHEKFVSRKEFTTITLVPDEELLEEGEVKREYQVYLYQNGDMKIALLFALPKGVSAGEAIADRVDYMLQTLELSSQKPGGGAATAPGGGDGAGGQTEKTGGPGF